MNTLISKKTQPKKEVKSQSVLYGKNKRVDIDRLSNKELFYFFEKINKEVTKRISEDPQNFREHFICPRNITTINNLIEEVQNNSVVENENEEQTLV